MPEEALFVHLSSLPKHVASKSRCYTKSPFRLAWSSLPPLYSLILLSNYFQDHELWESCRSRLLGCTTVACGAGRCGIYFGSFSRGWLCLRACTCTHILWFRPLCITCLSLKMPLTSHLTTLIAPWTSGDMPVCCWRLYSSVKANRTGSAEQHKPLVHMHIE